MEPVTHDPIADGITPGADPIQAQAPQGDGTNGASQDYDAMTTEQLEDILIGNAPTPQTKPTEEAAPPATANSETENGDDLDPNPAEGAKPRRIRMNIGGLPEEDVNVMFQARDMVSTGKAKSVADAILELTGSKPQPAQPADKDGDTPPVSPAATENEVPTSAAAIKAKIEDLKRQREEARTVLFDFQQADNLSDQIAQSLLDLRDAEREGQQSQTAQADWNKEQLEHINEVTRANPDLQDEGSELFQEFSAQRAIAETQNDPVFSRPDWSRVLLERAQNRLARLTGQAAPAAPKSPDIQTIPPARQQPAPSKPSRPVGSFAGQGADGPPPSKAELETLMDQADTETLERALSAPSDAETHRILLEAKRKR